MGMHNVRRLPLVGAAMAMVVAMAGCATPADPEDARPERYVEPATISAQAQQAYGEQTQEAYKEVVDLLMNESLKDDLLDPQRTTYTAEELSDGVVSHLAPRTQVVWNEYVDKALAGDAEAEETVSLLRVFGIKSPQLSLPPGGKVVTSQAISGAKVDLADGAAASTAPGATAAPDSRPLKISLEHSARLDYREGRAPYPGSVDRDLTFTLVPASSVAASATASPSATPGSSATNGKAPSSAPAASDTTLVSPATGARWLIATFDGTTTFAFDKGTKSTTAPTAS